MAAAVLMLASCTGGGGPRPTTSTTAPAPSTTALPTTVATTSSSTAPGDPAGSATLHVRGLTLPDRRTGGTGLRVLVRAVSPGLTLRRRGGGGRVAACPPAGGDCLELRPDSTTEAAFPGGVELRAAGDDATVEEVAVTYVPVDRTTTLVTPARPAGACAGPPCEATYSLTPGRAGAFSLNGTGGGGRPRLVLTAVSPNTAVSNRTLATVEGGGHLSIRATVEAGWEASLLHHEQTPDPVAAVTLEISWP